MEKMYEVLKFIEHGTHCRRSLDCVQGTSLMQRLKECPHMDRKGMLAWFREIARCVDQYHRSGSGQNYRYLNPCSIVVTEDNRLMLLDLEAPDNAGVLKQMQTGAVRNHFVRPVCGLGITKNHEADLFAYGKTIQFMLAYTNVHPALTGWEEFRLERVIGRCTGETGKKYQDFAQVLKALPQIPRTVPEKMSGGKLSLKRVAGGVGLGAAACLCLCVLLGVEKQGLVRAETEELYQEAEAEGEKKAKEKYENRLISMKAEQQEKLAAQAAAGMIAGISRQAMDITDKISAQEVERELLAAYDAILGYESDPVKAEEIRQKKSELENEKETGAEAVSENSP